VYLATVIDCYHQGVIGYALGDNDKTPLIEAAIQMTARNYQLRYSTPTAAAITPPTSSAKH
jgi:putative transposase